VRGDSAALSDWNLAQDFAAQTQPIGGPGDLIDLNLMSDFGVNHWFGQPRRNEENLRRTGATLMARRKSQL
jgi:hypothetical protein